MGADLALLFRVSLMCPLRLTLTLSQACELVPELLNLKDPEGHKQTKTQYK